MKILFVSSQSDPTLPPFNGDSQRTCLLYKACQQCADVDLLSFHPKCHLYHNNEITTFSTETSIQPTKTSKIKKWIGLLPFSNIQTIFPINHDYSQILNSIINKGNYDYIVTRYIYRAVYCGLWTYREKLIVDFDDDLRHYFINKINNKTSILSKIRLHLYATKSKQLTKRIVSQIKHAYFAEEKTAKNMNGTHLPNIPYYKRTCNPADFSSQKRIILFVGQLEYKPNQEGISYFLKHIYPSIQKKINNIEFRIVGLINNTQLRNSWEKYPGVVVTGYVEDIVKEYDNCHIVIAPIYHCGATNIKIIEALQMNRCCITTAEALSHFQNDLTNYVDVIGVNSDIEYQNVIIQMLSNSEANIQMALNGKNKIKDNYSFTKLTTIIENTVNT